MPQFFVTRKRVERHCGTLCHLTRMSDEFAIVLSNESQLDKLHSFSVIKLVKNNSLICSDHLTNKLLEGKSSADSICPFTWISAM